MRQPHTSIPIALAAGLAVGMMFIAWSWPALAHEAPKGWTYDYACCSNQDCREVPASAIKEDSRGFTIVRTGELIAYGDSRIRRSKDENWHWCSVAGLDDSRSLCLYVPNRGF